MQPLIALQLDLCLFDKAKRIQFNKHLRLIVYYHPPFIRGTSGKGRRLSRNILSITFNFGGYFPTTAMTFALPNWLFR